MEIKIADFNLLDMINDISNMFKLKCKEKGLEWKVKLSDIKNSIFVSGDGGKLKQALINILGNAVKFTDSGHVHFKVSAKGDNYYLFEAIDSGGGISAKAQKKIFDPFQQSEEGAQKGGTGLGLAISLKQVKLMDGKIAVESKIGKGSRFYFMLELKPPEKIAKQHLKLEKEVIQLKKGYTVKALVVDDSKINCNVMSKLLRNIGVKVIEAGDGLKAVEKTRKHKPDIIFMDYIMPNMNGVEAIKEIRKEFGDKIKTVMVSASAFDHEQKIFLKQAVTTCFQNLSGLRLSLAVSLNF